MDIGTLTGHIEFEDTLDSDFQIVITKVENFAKKFDNAFGTVAVGALAVVTAVTSITSAIVAMAKAGDDIDDVAENFNRLAGSAENASAILESMRKGVLDTVNDFKLMTEANRLLQAGVKGNAETFGVVTRGAKILAEEGYGKIETVMSQVNRALETGRAQFLRRIGLNVDVTKAETDLAKSLGTTRDHLNNLGRIEAGRMATLTALNKIVKDAGDIEADFGDRIDSTTAKLQNWFHTLNQQITISPHVTAAWDAIKKALDDAFGGSSQKLMDYVLNFVNKFADYAREYGPKIIKWIADTAHTIREIYDQVREAWDTVPEWFKEITENAAKAAIAVELTAKAMEVLTGAEIIASLAGLAHGFVDIGESATELGIKVPRYFSNIIGLGWRGLVVVVKDLGAAIMGVGASIAEFLGPIGLAAIAAGALYAGLKYFEKWDAVASFFNNLGSTLKSAVAPAIDATKIAVKELAESGFAQLGKELAKLSWNLILTDLRAVASLVGNTLKVVVELTKAIGDLSAALLKPQFDQLISDVKEFYAIFSGGEIEDFINAVKWAERYASALAAIARVANRQFSGPSSTKTPLLETIQPTKAEADARAHIQAGFVTPAASNIKAAEEDLTDFAEKLNKAISDLMEKLTQADVQVQAFHEVFKNRLTPAQRENLAIQQQLIPIYEKAFDAREKMTAAEAAWYAQAIRNIGLEKQRQEQALGFRHVTLEMIEAQRLSGQTDAQIGRQYHVSAEALKEYEDRLTFARNEQQDLSDILKMSSAEFTVYKDRLVFARVEHKNLNDLLKMSSFEFQVYKDYVALAKQEQLDLNKAVVAGVQPLENYASAQERANSALRDAKTAAKNAADAALEIAQIKARSSAVVQSLDIQLAADQAMGASAKRLFLDEQALEAARHKADMDVFEREFELRDKSKDADTNAVQLHKVAQQQMTIDFETESNKRLQVFLISQNKWFQTIKSIEDRFKALGTNISSNLASTFFGLGDDIDGHLHAAAERAHQAYIQIAADGKHTASELANAWKAWQDAADAASSTLAERIKSVWYDIKKTIIDVLNDILKYFTERFIVGLVKGMAGARLGQNFGAALGGVGGGGGRGSLLGNLLGIGSTAAPFFGGGGGAATAASVFASGGMVAGGTTAGIAAGTGTLAATGPGFGAAAAGGGTAAGAGGLGSTLTALASNPITWGVAAGIVLAWGIKQKGWFRGGEEGVKVNPARDKFLAQFAQYQPPGVGDSRNPPGFYGLAALLSQTHNDRLFSALTAAHTMKEFQAAEQAIAQSLAGRHIGPDGKEIPRITSLKLFERGGFVQPGDIQPAVLHGGGAGELIGPIHTLARMISAELRAQIVPSVDITTSFDRVVNKLGTKIDEIPSGEEMMTRTGVGGGAPDSTAALGVTRRVGAAGQKVIENNHVWHIEINGGVMDRSNVREIFKEHIIPLHKHANLIDEDGYAESTRRAVY